MARPRRQEGEAPKLGLKVASKKRKVFLSNWFSVNWVFLWFVFGMPNRKSQWLPHTTPWNERKVKGSRLKGGPCLQDLDRWLDKNSSQLKF